MEHNFLNLQNWGSTQLGSQVDILQLLGAEERTHVLKHLPKVDLSFYHVSLSISSLPVSPSVKAACNFGPSFKALHYNG